MIAWLQEAESFLRSWNVFSNTRKSPNFMKPGSSSPHSQEPATFPRLLWMCRNMINFLRSGIVTISSNPQAGGPPCFDRQRLLFQYMRSCHPYLEAVPPSATWGRVMPWWQRYTYHSLSWHSLICSLPYDRSTVSSNASSPHSVI
jgi:hypothetical protein